MPRHDELRAADQRARQSFAIMDRALELGINFFDTANRYGGRQGSRAATEEIIGRWFAQGGGRREKVVLATKVYGAMADWPNDGGLSARHIRGACDDSLRRLQTDHIDLYQMHHVDRDAPWDEIWQAMETLVQQGKVIYVGSSNFAGWHIAQANEAARKRATSSASSASRASTTSIARTVELEVLPACRAYGVGVIPWSPLAGGMLGGALQKVNDGRRAGEQVRTERSRSIAPAAGGVGERCAPSSARSPATWRWPGCCTNTVVTAPIIGPRTLEQLDGVAARRSRSRSTRRRSQALDEIFPGPGGRAPEAYAW